MLPGCSVDEALGELLGQFERPQPVSVSPADGEGLVLASPLICNEVHPAHDTSAMDGYAVRADCLKAADRNGPVVLTMVEDIRAGFPPEKTLQPGQTSRISTGGLVPTGADAVVMREVVEADGTEIKFFAPVESGLNIRRRGEHLGQGDEVVSAGRVVNPAVVGMAAYLGVEELKVFPSVSVAVLATGSELVGSGSAVAKGQIRDSNSVSLAAALRQLGCRVTMQERVPDDPGRLDEALERAFSTSRVVMTSGGISAGWHDLVRQRIEKLGGQFTFHKLKMRPGKPLAFGRCQDSHFFCLPGNPVSSMVTFEVFVKPALLKLMGRASEVRYLEAVLEQEILKKPGFSIFYRGVMRLEPDGARVVRLTGPQGSHMLRSLVDANVLIRTEEKDERLPSGSTVRVMPYG